MRWGVVTFPGSLDDADTVWVLEQVLNDEVVRLWHGSATLPDVDCVVLPGGFSYGDYLRPGAIARFAPIMPEVMRFAAEGGPVVGICNGFQILCEAGLLPGALVRNESLNFVCDWVWVRVEETASPLLAELRPGELLRLPIKHGAGCFVADETTLSGLEAARQVAFRYVDAEGRVTAAANPNGSAGNIAGLVGALGNVLGLMPHPEHASENFLGGEDGLRLMRSIRAGCLRLRAGRAERAAVP